MSNESHGGTRRGFVAGAAASVAAGAALLASRDAEAGPAATMGEWSKVFKWPCVAIHMSLLPSSTLQPAAKILTWADDDGNYPPNRLADLTRAFVVTIKDNATVLTSTVHIDNHQTNLFCSGHSYLPDGRLLVVGGHEGTQYFGSADVTIFNYASGYSWQRQEGDAMTGGRWYASAVTMGNGEVVVLSGTDKTKNDYNPLPQVWQPNAPAGQHWRNLTSAKLKFQYYPTIFAAPDGRVFQSGSGPQTRYLNTSQSGKWEPGPTRTYKGDRFYGGAAMYDEAKILMTGGDSPPTNTAEVINLNDKPQPQWHKTGAMNWARRHMNLTILADGSVLATHGSTAAGNNAQGAVLAAEIWSEQSGKWSIMNNAAVKRLYHSTAILLPDGRVLCAGGGRPSPGFGIDNQNAEIFSPPYLFKGVRPVISGVIGGAPNAVGYGQTFQIITPNAAEIGVVRAIRLSSVTHTNNMNQRAKRFAFQPDVPAQRLNCQAPASPNSCPPGHYLLFILNKAGAPSIAKIIRLG